MVRHLTRVVVAPTSSEIADRLAALGFSIRRDGAWLVAESILVTPEEAQHHLRSLGVRDAEYRLQVEYERAWGFL